MKKVILTKVALISFLSIFSQTEIVESPQYSASNTTIYDDLHSASSLETRSLDVNLVVGKTPTSHSVSTKGAFNYAIPIALPQGTAGVTPNLSLNYSSQSGSGIAGYGWSLSGFSSISRTNKNHFNQEKSENVLFDYTDPFTLDGNRLVLVSGLQGINNSTYKTEVETFSIVTAMGQQGDGPEWFRVQLKDGTIMEYGNTPDSKCHKNDKGSILEWKLNKTIDRNGNYIEYKYKDFGEEVLPIQINYTGNDFAEITPYYQIVFEYEGRTDKEFLIASEKEIEIKKERLLKVIRISFGESNTQVKKYEFNYGFNYYSYLNDITEYGGDGNHFNPISFNYWDAGHNFSEITFNDHSLESNLYSGDFNGDGVSDLLTTDLSTLNKVVLKPFLGSINGPYFVNSNVSLNTSNPVFEFANCWHNFSTDNNDLVRYTSYGSDNISRIDIGDYNGDGKDDILVIKTRNIIRGAKHNIFIESMFLYYSESTPSTLAFAAPEILEVPKNAYHTNEPDNPTRNNYLGIRNSYAFGDFDGDGAKDIFINSHDGFKIDYEHGHNTYYPVIYRPRISIYPQLVNYGSNYAAYSLSYKDDFYLLDMNGNRKTDIMHIYEHDEERKVEVLEFNLLSNSFIKNTIYTQAYPNTNTNPYPNKYQLVKVGDFNGDGKSDILTTDKVNPSQWVFSYSDGNSFHHYNYLTYGIGDNSQLAVGDVNSDGKADLIGVYDNPNAPARIKVYYSSGLDFNTYTYDISSINFDNSSNFLLIDSEGKGFLSALVSDEAQKFKYSEVSFNHANKFGQLHYISTGFNELTEVNYLSIANQFQDPLYSNTNTTSYYPNIEYNKPLYVVTSIKSPDGAGMNGSSNGGITSKYLYTRARLNLQGRGFLGFEKVESFTTSPTREDAHGNPIITLNSDEYELENTFVFPRLIKSHHSQVVFTSANLFLERSYKNLYSKEYEYSTISLDDNKRFINQLDKTIEGDNIKKSKTVTEYNFNSLTSSQNGNVDEIVKMTGDDQKGKVVTTTEFTFGNFGTLIPAHITEKRISSVRTFDNVSSAPVNSTTQYNYSSINGNLLWQKEMDPDNSSLLIQKSYFDYSNTGIPKRLVTTIPNHTSPDRTTLLTYDDTDRFLLEKVVDFNGSNEYKEVWTYDVATGLKMSYDDILPNNGIASYTYNSLYQKTSETDELGNLTTINREFDVFSNSSADAFIPDAHLYSITTSTPNLGSSKVYLDHNGQERLIETTDFNGDITKQVINYDDEGRVETTTTPFNAIHSNYTTYSYDFLGRHISTENKDISNQTLSSIHTDYTLFQGVNPFVYQNDDYETFIYRDGNPYSSTKADPTGMMIQSSDNSGIPVEHHYNSFGSLSETKVQGSTVSSSDYNHLGQQTQLNEINSGVTSYTYNQVGELISQSDANNNTTSDFIYDRFGRMLQKEVSGQGTYIYEYSNSGNGIGQIERIVAPNGTEVTYQYNVNGQVSEQTDIIAGISYTKQFEYDNVGRVNLERYATGTEVAYQYNADGYLELVYNPETGQAFFDGESVDDLGNWTTYSLYDGNSTTKTYDELGRPKTVVVGGIYEREYEFDLKTANLNMRKDLLRNNTETFTYDGLDRLVEARLNGNLYLGMQYDDNGNIDNKSDIGDYTYHPTKKNALVMVDNIQNLIHSTSQDIEYDELHNPKSIVENGNEWYFEYDVNHHRNRAQIISGGGSTTTRVYVGNSEYQYDQSGDLLYSVDYVAGGDGLCALVVRDFTPTATTNEPQVLTVYKDYLGSINLLVAENGTVAAEQEFDPWGRYRNATTWTASTTLPALPNWLWRGYTGHEYIEEFQLINMNGRLYDPYLGRMLSPDNFVQDAVSTQNYNRYSYALNNPLKYTDPDGEWLWAIPAAVGFSVGYISHGASTGNWGSSALLSGAIGAGVAVLGFYSGGASSAVGIAGGFKSAGLSGHAATVALGYSGQYAASAVVSTILPSVNVPLGNNFSLSLSAGVGFGPGGISGGANASVIFDDGTTNLSAGYGTTNNSSAWSVGATHSGYGGSYYRTSYSGVMSQVVGGIGLVLDKVSVRLENDFFGDRHDRWRSNALEIGIGNFVFGTNLTNNDPKGEGQGIKNLPDRRGNYNTGIHQAWENGKVYSSPWYAGYRSGSNVTRLGFSHPSAQDLTQNNVHRLLPFGRQHYYVDYSQFTGGLHMYSGFYNPYTLW